MVSLALPAEAEGRVAHASGSAAAPGIAQTAEDAVASQRSQFALHMIDEADAVFVCAERNSLLRLLAHHWAACHAGTPLPLALIAQAQLHAKLLRRAPPRRRPPVTVSARKGDGIAAAGNMPSPAPAAVAVPAARPPSPPAPTSEGRR